VSEAACKFGPESGLLGIYSDAGRGAELCCLLINSGIVPRIGPHRMNVKIARALAAAGVDSLRFDLSGLGDSRPAAGAANYIDQAVHDIRAAMDFVEQRSGRGRRFAIFGICSGAVNGYHAALADERIDGLLMLDGFWYRTRWTEPVRLWKRFRAMSVRRLLAAFSRKLRRAVIAPPPPAEPRADIFATDGSGNLPPAQFAAGMNRITERGAQVFLLYTSSVTGLVSYDAQIRHAFQGEPFATRIRSEARGDIDHTAVLQIYQRHMTRIVCDWVAGVSPRPRSRAE
jgi:hypothetical protein